MCVSCKETQSKSNRKVSMSNVQIPTMETSNESSLAKVWIDASTGHKVEKLVIREGDNRSFYFHNNPFLKSKDGKGDLMVFFRKQWNR